MDIEKSAGAVVFYREKNKAIKYLLLKHRSGYWNFPKGLIEEKESSEEAALREIKEETGLKKLKIIPGFKENIRYFIKVKYPYQIKKGFKLDQTVLKFVTYFLVESSKKEVEISFEHQDYGWFDFEKALEKLKKYKINQDVLKKANDFLKNLWLKHYCFFPVA